MRTSYRGQYETKKKKSPTTYDPIKAGRDTKRDIQKAKSKLSKHRNTSGSKQFIMQKVYEPTDAPQSGFSTLGAAIRNFIPNFTPTGGGGGGGGTTTPAPITWSEKYRVNGAPTWWKGMLPSAYDGETSYAALVNNMIPFLSPEDQRSVASNLARLYPDAFGNYSPEKVNFGTPPSELTTEMRDMFKSSQRGQQVLSALDALKAASGVGEDKLGPGYQFLRHISKTMSDFGGGVPNSGTHQTRQQFLQMMSALDPLLAETSGEKLGAFGPIAKSLVTPFFSGGALVPVSKDQNGNWVFGQGNKGWF